MKKITRFDDKPTQTSRSFCARCGSPILYEKDHSPHMSTFRAHSLPAAPDASRAIILISQSARIGSGREKNSSRSWAFPGWSGNGPKTKKRVKPRETD